MEKSYINFLMEGNEGETFRNVVDNLDESDFEDSANEYFKYKTKKKKMEKSKCESCVHRVYTNKGEVKDLAKVVYKIRGEEETWLPQVTGSLCKLTSCFMLNIEECDSFVVIK